jgi:hypothetical protein
MYSSLEPVDASGVKSTKFPMPLGRLAVMYDPLSPMNECLVVRVS